MTDLLADLNKLAKRHPRLRGDLAPVIAGLSGQRTAHGGAVASGASSKIASVSRAEMRIGTNFTSGGVSVSLVLRKSMGKGLVDVRDLRPEAKKLRETMYAVLSALDKASAEYVSPESTYANHVICEDGHVCVQSSFAFAGVGLDADPETFDQLVSIIERRAKLRVKVIRY